MGRAFSEEVSEWILEWNFLGKLPLSGLDEAFEFIKQIQLHSKMLPTDFPDALNLQLQEAPR